MSIYVDSSALLKRYLEELDSAEADRILSLDPSWVSANVTLVEVRRTLSRDLSHFDLTRARREFELDWGGIDVIKVDASLCERAAEFAEATGVRTLDALHFAAAQRAGAPRVTFVTFDLRQANAARSLGWTVLGT
ncbi:MAG TPA: type II toxin-antitoxin system VapC family toxin [Gaiellaceae bacterium]